MILIKLNVHPKRHNISFCKTIITIVENWEFKLGWLNLEIKTPSPSNKWSDNNVSKLFVLYTVNAY